MSIKIRIGTFETNSSSTHTLVVSRNYALNYGLETNKITIKFPVKMFDFGRHNDIYTDASSKFSYVWQHLCSKIKYMH